MLYAVLSMNLCLLSTDISRSDMKIQLPENIDQHWLWSDPVKFQWWLQLLGEVGDGECERTVRGVVCKFGYGELVTTQGELAKLWKTSTEKAQAFLRKLESKGEIRRKTDAKLTQITICNIEEYDIFGRNLDTKLTQGRKTDAILTQLIDVISNSSEEDRRNLDAKLTQLANFKRKEAKENIYTTQVTFPDGNVREDESSRLLESPEGGEGKEKAKPKKPAKPKKEKTKKSPTLVGRARVVFEEFYQSVYENPYYWAAKDAANMKQLLQKISYSRQHRENPLPVDDEAILEALRKFLDSINKGWVMDNFSVTTINSQYNNIISEIKNRTKPIPKNAKSNNSKTTQGWKDIGANLTDSYRQRTSILADIQEADRRFLQRRESVSDIPYEELPAIPSDSGI